MDNQNGYDQEKKPKSAFRIAFKAAVQLILVVAFLIAMVFISRSIGKSNQPIQQSDVKSEGMIVETISIAPIDEQLKITTTGTVQVRNNIDIITQVSGRVIAVNENFKDGGTFEANTVLFKIEPTDYNNNIRRLQAEVEKAQTGLALQEAEAISAIEEWQTLNSIPAPDLVARKPQMDQAQAQLKSARAQLSNARLDLSRTKFELPFSGRVVRSNVEVGQYVQAGQSYGTLYARDSLEISVPVQDSLLQWFNPGTSQAIIQTRYRGVDIQMQGDIARVSGELDSETRFASLIVIPKDDEWIKLIPGVFVDVTLVGPVIEKLWRVPNDVLQEGQKIWAVDQNDLLQKIEPQILNIGENETLILSKGQSARLVKGMIDGAADGIKVRVAGDKK